MVEVPVGEKDDGGRRIGPEKRFGLLFNLACRAGQARVDEHPRALRLVLRESVVQSQIRRATRSGQALRRQKRACWPGWHRWKTWREEGKGGNNRSPSAGADLLLRITPTPEFAFFCHGSACPKPIVALKTNAKSPLLGQQRAFQHKGNLTTIFWAAPGLLGPNGRWHPAAW